MANVYRHRPFANDLLLGRVDVDGKVYRTQIGPDEYVGRVHIETGKIYESRLGPDKHIGRVELDTGKIFRSKFGPDEYLARVDRDGHFHRHKPLASDPYVGCIETMYSFAHAGAAFLLLLWPILEAHEADEEKG